MSKPHRELYVVEKIIGSRGIGAKKEYRVVWKGYGLDGATWEPLSNLDTVKSMIKSYEKSVSEKGNAQTAGKRRHGRPGKNASHSSERHSSKSSDSSIVEVVIDDSSSKRPSYSGRDSELSREAEAPKKKQKRSRSKTSEETPKSMKESKRPESASDEEAPNERSNLLTSLHTITEIDEGRGTSQSKKTLKPKESLKPKPDLKKNMQKGNRKRQSPDSDSISSISRRSSKDAQCIPDKAPAKDSKDLKENRKSSKSPITERDKDQLEDVASKRDNPTANNSNVTTRLNASVDSSASIASNASATNRYSPSQRSVLKIEYAHFKYFLCWYKVTFVDGNQRLVSTEEFRNGFHLDAFKKWMATFE